MRPLPEARRRAGAYLRQHGIFIAIWLLLILPTIGFVLTFAVFLAIVYWPADIDNLDTGPFTTTESHLIVLTHGVNDDASTWIEPLLRVYQEEVGYGRAVAVDWSTHAHNALRCALTGRRIGHRIGKLIAMNNHLTSVHLIGHSCGAFVVLGACETIKQSKPRLQVQTTYLDPVSVYGLSRDYGIEHFGSCADYSDAFIDTGDDVPGSNQRLPHAHTYDVTELRLQAGSDIEPHLWPTTYYRQLVTAKQAPDYRSDPNLKQRKPPGVMETIR